MTPWLDDGDLKLYHGDCLEVLRGLPDRSVHMCATSPPFYGLRDYGVDRQIGLEESPDQWVERLVEVFREVRRVLRDDGTLWVEIGDSYAGSWGAQGRELRDGDDQGASGSRRNPSLSGNQIKAAQKKQTRTGSIPPGASFKPKDLLGQPWLLAFALRADGWYLRSEIIWARPNPMPESVTDRPTKAHSTIFLLSKQSRYFYDADAIREELKPATIEREKHGYKKAFASQFNGHPTDKRHVDGSERSDVSNPAGANARSVWTVPTEPTPFAHFATWPQKLVARMVKAGTSEQGCCPECGAPWERITGEVAVEPDPTQRSTAHYNTAERYGAGNGGNGGLDSLAAKMRAGIGRGTVGWQPSCSHDHPPVPCTVLDIFAGSGTTLKVARDHGRHSVGIELNEQYLEIAADRLAQQSLLTGEAA